MLTDPVSPSPKDNRMKSRLALSSLIIAAALWVAAILVILGLAGCSNAPAADLQPSGAVTPTAQLGSGEDALPPPPTGLATLLPASLAAPEPVAVSPLATPLPTDPPPMPTSTAAPAAQTPAPVVAPTEALGTEIYSYQVVAAYPHDPDAFTQGLVWQDGIFYEGTGRRGRSSLRKVEPASGAVTQRIDLAEPYFGEGIAILGDRLYQLTWQEQTGFVYDKDSFELLDTWSYPGEGWGLTTDGQRLIMSDGTNVLRFLDPETLEQVGAVQVTDPQGNRVDRLNELEYVDGEVLANVWQTDWIARIDPATGQVRGWIDLRGLLPAEQRTQPVDVLNGIAYDAATDRLYVTGKLWPTLFEIDLVPAS